MSQNPIASTQPATAREPFAIDGWSHKIRPSVFGNGDEIVYTREDMCYRFALPGWTPDDDQWRLWKDRTLNRLWTGVFTEAGWASPGQAADLRAKLAVVTRELIHGLGLANELSGADPHAQRWVTWRDRAYDALADAEI